MKYTDKELIRASQIAYFTINDEVLRQTRVAIEGDNEANPIAKANYTLSELYEHSDAFRASAYKDIISLAKDYYKVTVGMSREEVLSHVNDPKVWQMISARFDIIDDITNGEIGSWKVVSYVDNNNIFETGMAGKLVDGSWVHSNFSESGDGLAAMVFETGDRFTA